MSLDIDEYSLPDFEHFYEITHKVLPAGLRAWKNHLYIIIIRIHFDLRLRNPENMNALFTIFLERNDIHQAKN